MKWSQVYSEGIQKVEIQNIESDKDRKKIIRTESIADYLKSNKTQDLKKIILIGDTGCRLKENATKSSLQDCQDPKKWPYAEIVKQIAKEKPDLIIHTGDFHYRESCTSDKCKTYSKSIGYNWEAWNDDFFIPSIPAFKVAPWIFVRGNHEDCSRAYQVYKAYMAPRTWKSDCTDYEDLEMIRMGDLLLVNLDSSAIADRPDPSEENLKIWKNRFAEVEQLLAKQETPPRYIWLLTHKPIYGFAPLAGGYGPVNVNLRKIFEESILAKKVQIIISGHIHGAQVSWAKEMPTQLVIGHSGTSLDNFKKSMTEFNLQMLNYEKSANVVSDFGYAVLERKSAGSPWGISFRGQSGKSQFECKNMDSRNDCLK